MQFSHTPRLIVFSYSDHSKPTQGRAYIRREAQIISARPRAHVPTRHSVGHHRTSPASPGRTLDITRSPHRCPNRLVVPVVEPHIHGIVRRGLRQEAAFSPLTISEIPAGRWFFSFSMDIIPPCEEIIIGSSILLTGPGVAPSYQLLPTKLVGT